MGYLFCRNCKQYYKLAEGESPDDFASCDCGAPFEYYKNPGEFIHASHRQVPVKSINKYEKRRLEDKKIKELAHKIVEPSNFENLQL